MSDRPPRQGARWGDDQEEKPSEPSRYSLLIEKYGESNVHAAASIKPKIKTDYPDLEILNTPDEDFTDHVLRLTSNWMTILQEDERPHSMPETLDKLKGQLGSIYARQRQISNLSEINYGRLEFGDEHQGKYHTEQRLQEENAALDKIDKELEELKSEIWWHQNGGFVSVIVFFSVLAVILYSFS